MNITEQDIKALSMLFELAKPPLNSKRFLANSIYNGAKIVLDKIKDIRQKEILNVQIIPTKVTSQLSSKTSREFV